MNSEKCILITGAAGFLGNRVVNLLQKRNSKIFLLDKDISNNDGCISADITKEGEWQNIIANLGVTHLVHLAGLTRCQDAKLLTKIHIDGTRNLLNATKNLSWVFLASSGAVYGIQTNDALMIDEKQTLNPINEYGKSKSQQEQLVEEMIEQYGIRNLCVGRMSNLIGPGQSRDFFLGQLIAQFLSNDSSNQNKNIKTGNLNFSRDFLDVRDASSAIVELMLLDSPGVFNISSGREYWLRDIVQMIAEVLKVRISLIEEQKFNSLVHRQKLSNLTITKKTGWIPKISIKQTISNMIEYDMFID